MSNFERPIVIDAPYSAIAKAIQDVNYHNPYGKNRNRSESYYKGIENRVLKRRKKNKLARKSRKNK